MAENTAPHKGSILLVEDDEFLRSLVVRALGEVGYETEVAKDGEDALAHIARQMPDLILLDLVLPGFSGFELIAKLRQNDATAKIPFIVLSNSAESQSKKQATDLGAAGYLVKAQSTPSDIAKAAEAYFAVHPAP